MDITECIDLDVDVVFRGLYIVIFLVSYICVDRDSFRFGHDTVSRVSNGFRHVERRR